MKSKNLGILLIVTSFYFLWPNLFFVSSFLYYSIFISSNVSSSLIDTAYATSYLNILPFYAVGIFLLFTGLHFVRRSKIKVLTYATQKQLKIISVIFLAIGMVLISSYLYSNLVSEHHSIGFQSEQARDFEYYTIQLIGNIISMLWYLPFFIISYLLYRKSVKIKQLSG